LSTAEPAEVQREEQPKVTANEVASAPVKPLPTAEPAAVQRQESPKVAANEITSAPVKPLPTAEPAAVQTEESSRIATNDTAPQQREVTEPKPTQSATTEKRSVRSNRKTEVAAIPTARPVMPEVRRAEPAAPAEGPEEVVSTNTGENAEEVVAPVPTSRSKKEQTAKTKRTPRNEARPEFVITNEADEAEEVDQPAQKLPKGRVRARFIGVTADGNWMLALPKDKIVIVPPPPGG
jgi:hypothetical protein